jgi:hypothetical protein
MAAPKFVPSDPLEDPRTYASPPYVPAPWRPDRPAAILGRQPTGERLGAQGPDQGYALLLAERLRGRVKVTPGERVDDALQGGILIGLRRASLFGRAPIIHDLTIGLTVWGFLDDSPPHELVAYRKPRFEGIADTLHHYAEGRAVADQVPEATLRLSHQEVMSRYPAEWEALLGL